MKKGKLGRSLNEAAAGSARMRPKEPLTLKGFVAQIFELDRFWIHAHLFLSLFCFVITSVLPQIVVCRL
jgi:hypothetical protein